jgi:hypothetical protein
MADARRAENRKLLRQKIAERRNQRSGGGPSAAETARRDPTTALLQLGLDDAELLRNARDLVKMDVGALKQSMRGAQAAIVEQQAAPTEEDEEEEEAPPPAQ